LTARQARAIPTVVVAISKGRFAAGLQCAKRLHLECHSPELRGDEGAGRPALAQAGIEVGILARAAFPGGVLVAATGWDEAVATTSER